MRIARRALAAIALAAGVVAEARAADACPAYCVPGNRLFDAVSGMCLPETLPGYLPTARSPEVDDALQQTDAIGVGFDQRDPRFAVTLFVYDRTAEGDADDLEHLKTVIGEIRRLHPDAKNERMGRGSLPVAGNPAPAMGGFFTWRDGSTDVGSFLWLVPRGRKYLKVRASYERTAATDGERMAKAMDAIQLLVRRICIGEGGKP